MAIKIKRGLEANRTGITPAEGELLYTTDNKKLFIGDGSTAGGVAIDVDTLEGLSASQFLRSDVSDIAAGPLTIAGTIYDEYDAVKTDITGLISGSTFGTLIEGKTSGHVVVGIRSNDPTDQFAIIVDTNGDGTYGKKIFTVSDGGLIETDGNTIWHAGNDGSGSGLDADTLDTLQATQFLRSDINDIYQGSLLQLQPSSALSFGLEIGYIGGTATTPLIDFHSGATGIDFDSRIIASGGDGTNGGGALTFVADNVDFTKITSDQVLLDNISSVVTNTGSPAVFIYDTTKDSDGGAWRDRTSGTSWFNETLNTTIRGSTKKFPAIAIIVAEVVPLTSYKITIYDATDPTLPMWMIFTNGAFLDFANIKDLSMVNGILCTCSRSNDDSSGIVRYIDFIGDYSDKLSPTVGRTTSNNSRSIVNRNVPGSATVIIDLNKYSHEGLFYIGINLVVVKGTPVDPIRGLPTPTIYINTSQGLTRIAHDGTDSRWTDNGGSVEQVLSSSISDDYIYFGVDNNPNGSQIQVQKINSVLINAVWNTTDAYTGRKYTTQGSIGAGNWTKNLTPLSYGAVSSAVKQSAHANIATNRGIFKILPNLPFAGLGLHAVITKNFNTGYQFGDIAGVHCTDILTTNLTGGNDNDRSYNNNPMAINGTITRTAVRTGADLVSYNGWSTSNFLQQAYTSALDFGTGDFNMMLWFKLDVAAGSTLMLFERVVGGAGIDLFFSTGTILNLRVGGITLNDSSTIDIGEWVHAVCLRKDGIAYMYLNGILVDSDTASGDISGTTPVSHIGKRSSGDAFTNGHIALFKIGAEAPTETQIKQIYDSEFHMFQKDSNCVLSSTTNTEVNAVAYDTYTNFHHYAGTDNLDTFDDLIRIDSEVGAYTSLAANNGIVIKGT